MANKNKGFSLVEMLVVATIAALLAAAGMVSYTTLNRNSRNARREADLQQIRAAMELYRVEESSFPSGSLSQVISTLQSEGYLTGADFTDPRSGAGFEYTIDWSPSGSYPGCPSTKSYLICATKELSGGGSEDYCVCNP